MRGSTVICLAAATIAIAALAGCNAEKPAAAVQPEATTIAPAPPAHPEPDTSANPVERAAPPMLKPVALGSFEPGDPVAEAVTGKLEIEDANLRGANGASFTTERVAILKGGDEYTAGETYAEAMMIEPTETVELRRVLEETPPSKVPGNALCANAHTTYIAMAKIDEDKTQVVKLMGLQGADLPAPKATGIALCASTHYISK
jgi:hypothetical protein